MTRIAVLSDVHGYTPALEVVLSDIRDRTVDRIIVAGDHCDGGPNPSGAIRLIREAGCEALYGNTDLRMFHPDRPCTKPSQCWTRDRLSGADLAWLAALPFAVRVPHPAASSDADPRDLLVVHANPVDVDRHLSPSASDAELLDIIGGESARTIAFGHLHVAWSRTVGPYTLVDVAATGTPRDGDLRPRYALFEPTDDGWRHEYVYLDYPLAGTQMLMEASGMPNWPKAWRQLQRATYSRPV